MKFAITLSAAALLAGCQAAPAIDPVSGLEKNSQAWRGQKFAQNRCADCHSIDFAETSPVPEAPSFAAIANTPDLDSAKLAQWLRDHRNYPNEMYFEIPAEHIDDLGAYILTLRRAEKPGRS
ncbi:c-type cytochrome [Tsuneonella sp. HG249]